MNVWKGAWFLAKHELKKDRWKNLFTLALVGYLLLFTVPMLLNKGDEDAASFNWAMDFIYLSLLPILGFCVNSSMKSYWKTDAYTNRMAQWRTMPISSKQIALGRMIQLVIILFLAQLIFFGLQYLFLALSGTDINIGSFVLYGLFWFAYSLTIATTYVYWELGHSGKAYLYISIIYIIIYLIATIGLALLHVESLTLTTLQAVENGDWWIVIAIAAIAVLAVVIGTNRIESRLEKRSYKA